MNKGISISVEWWDEDLIIFVFSASNGRFCGEAELYLEPKALERLANDLSGFPRDGRDQRGIDLGAFSIIHAGGGVQMRFACLDAACHPAVDVKIRTEDCAAFGELQPAALRIPIEAAAIDEFVNQLRNFKIAAPKTITLPMTP